MTDEQIKQNAEKYVDKLCKRECAKEWERLVATNIAGAHSRDKEIEQLKSNYHDMFLKLAYRIEQLRNSRISVKDRLPERMTSRDSNGVKIIDCCSKDVFGYDASYKIGRLVCYNHESKSWESHDAYTIGEITHWMSCQYPN